MKAVMSKGDADKQDEAADGPLIDAATSSAAAKPAALAAEARNAQLAPAPVDAESAATPAAPAAEAPQHETRGQMQQRHKREMKAVKDAVKKLGKKRKDEGEKLEADTMQRHAAELAALDAGAAAAAPADGSDVGAEALVARSLYGLSTSEGDKPAGKKESTRAQKRREKAVQQQAEREQRIAAEQAEMGDSERQVEEAELARLLAPQGLALRDIPPDGNCLYRAVEDQLAVERASTGSSLLGHEALRAQAADYMRSHEKEFAPFVLPEVAEGDDVHEQYQRYCDSMASSAVWGGQAELGALAHVLQRRIDVFSVGMPTVAMGEEYADNGPPLRVSYQRHAYELGEHYNSVVPAKHAAVAANGVAEAGSDEDR